MNFQKYLKYKSKYLKLFGGTNYKSYIDLTNSSMSKEEILSWIKKRSENTMAITALGVTYNPLKEQLSIIGYNWNEYELIELQNLICLYRIYNDEKITIFIYTKDEIQQVINYNWYKGGNDRNLLTLHNSITNDEIKLLLDTVKFNIKVVNVSFNILKNLDEFPIDNFFPKLDLPNIEEIKQEIILRFNCLIESIKKLNFNNCVILFIKLIKLSFGPYNNFSGINKMKLVQDFLGYSPPGFKEDKQIMEGDLIYNYMINSSSLFIYLIKYFVNENSNFIEENIELIFELYREYFYTVLFNTNDGLTVYNHMKCVSNYLEKVCKTKFIIMDCTVNTQRCGRGILLYECPKSKKFMIIVSQADNLGNIDEDYQIKLFANPLC
jgi:hypothetical protein